jgi:hypothetical protein
LKKMKEGKLLYSSPVGAGADGGGVAHLNRTRTTTFTGNGELSHHLMASAKDLVWVPDRTYYLHAVVGLEISGWW